MVHCRPFCTLHSARMRPPGTLIHTCTGAVILLLQRPVAAGARSVRERAISSCCCLVSRLHDLISVSSLSVVCSAQQGGRIQQGRSDNVSRSAM